ncbi:MAG: 50S ribosomal protein L25, partial [Candidatus Omnitrophota bacterium]
DVQVRSEIGKSGAQKVRLANGIPAIVYGGKSKPMTVTVDRKAFEHIMRVHHGQSIIFQVNVMEKEKNVQDFFAVIKEMQHDPVGDQVTHVDFARISLKEKIEVKVPVVAQGEPLGVKKGGGSLEHHLWEIKIVCLPTQIPQHINVEVSHLDLNQSILVKDLVLPEGVVAHHDPETIVMTVVPPMKEEAAKSEEEQGPQEPEVTKEKKEKKEEAPAADAQASKKDAPAPKK